MRKKNHLDIIFIFIIIGFREINSKSGKTFFRKKRGKIVKKSEKKWEINSGSGKFIPAIGN